MRPQLLILAVAGTLSCQPAARRRAEAPSSPDELALAPWANATLAPAAVPMVYVSVWRTAANRHRCALLAPAELDRADAAKAHPRPAAFSGGWGVAYDLPGERSAFGIAGTGVAPRTGDVYDEWPVKRDFPGGGRVGYGPEGGVVPNWLAYLRIPGQDCLYNVWSRRGRAHLERLLSALRFVAVE